MLLRLNRVTGADPDQSSLDDPQRMSRIRQLWDRQWEAGMGMQIATGPLLEQVLATAGVAVALALVMPWWVSAAPRRCSGHPGRDLPPDRPGRVRRVGRTVRAAEAVHVRLPASHRTGRQGAPDLRSRVRSSDSASGTSRPRRCSRTGGDADAGPRRTSWSAPAGSLLGVGAIAYAGWLSAQGRLDLTGLATADPAGARSHRHRGLGVRSGHPGCDGAELDGGARAGGDAALGAAGPPGRRPAGGHPAGRREPRGRPRHRRRSCSTRSTSTIRAATGSSSIG